MVVGARHASISSATMHRPYKKTKTMDYEHNGERTRDPARAVY